MQRRRFLQAVSGLALAVPSTAQAHHSAAHQARARIRAMITAEARALGIDPALGVAVAHAESHFDPRAESHVGARGVMQIMPATCRGEYALHPDCLWEARINIRMGLHFLGRLLERYAGQEPFALSYYNGGSRVGDLPNARIIPATRPYVDKVLELKRRYAHEI